MTLQERVEACAAGRAGITIVIAVALAAMTIGGLPESGLRRDLAGRAAPVLNAAGLDQRWDLFAPDPRRASLDLAARITHADGSTESWSLPRGDALLGAYSGY
ncbi:MAG: hypothetical protein ACRDKX_01095, partial [Solirubrobacterales bacterium]